MKKILIAVLTLLLAAGCAGSKPSYRPSSSPKEEIWPHDDIPVSVSYSRMWVYSASAQSDDPALLEELADAVKALEIGEKTEQITDDDTDILTFTFANGDTLRLEFENSCWVISDKERRIVKGLEQVRAVLDRLIAETEQTFSLRDQSQKGDY